MLNTCVCDISKARVHNPPGWRSGRRLTATEPNLAEPSCLGHRVACLRRFRFSLYLATHRLTQHVLLLAEEEAHAF